MTAKLVPPKGFTRHAELADLIPLVGLHRAAILAAVVEPWRCGGCEKAFYVPAVDARAFIDAVECSEAECPHKGGK